MLKVYPHTDGRYLIERQELIKVIPIDTLDKAVTRKTVEQLDRGLYILETIPKRWLTKLRDQLCGGVDVWEYIRQEELRLKMEDEGTLPEPEPGPSLEDEAREGVPKKLEGRIDSWRLAFKEYHGEYVKRSSPDKVTKKRTVLYKGQRRTEMARAACVMEWCNDVLARSPRPKLGELSEAVNTVYMELEVYYLPDSPRTFRDRYLSRLAQGESIMELVKPKRVSNGNAAKFASDDELESWMIQMRVMGQNYPNAFIARKIRLMCSLTDRKVPSESWVTHYLAKHSSKFLTSVHRYGKNDNRKTMYSGYAPIKNAVFASDCWQIDGTRFNLIGHKDENGKERFIYIIAVRDVHSGDVLGVTYDYREDHLGVVNALKMAVFMTGHLPYQLVHDRFPGHNHPKFKQLSSRMEAHGMKITITTKATGKAQVERFFGTLQSVFMNESPFYYGEGIRSSRQHNHRSSDYLKAATKKAKELGWDFESAWRHAHSIVENYRNTPLSDYSRKHKSVSRSPAQLFAQSEKPHVTELADHEFAWLFWEHKELDVRHNAIIHQHDHEEYTYNVIPYEVLEAHKRLGVLFDPLQSDHAYLYDPKREMVLCKVDRAEEAQIYGPNKDMRPLGKIKTHNEAIEAKRQARLNEKLQPAIDGGYVDEETGELITNEVALLQQGTSAKHDYESEETAYLLERKSEWGDGTRAERALARKREAQKQEETYEGETDWEELASRTPSDNSGNEPEEEDFWEQY